MTTRPKKQVGVTKAEDSLSRFKLSEIGSIGLPVFDGVSTDEIKRELNFPQSVRTFKEMSYHSTINGSLSFFDTIISKAVWEFKPPKDATEEEKDQCRIINEMMQDLEDGSWTDFIRDVMTINIYGFSVHEKVYRRRYKVNGSMYNDGLIGWRKLPIRSQESIEKFLFSDSGNEIVGVQQNISNLSDPYNQYSKYKTPLINIRRSKFMLFRQGKHRGDPYGKSPLRDAYVAWRFLTEIESLECIGAEKDLVGVPVLTLPPSLLSTEAGENEQSLRRYYENEMRNLQAGEQSAVILPAIFDPDTKQALFKLELLSTDSKRGFDLTKIKEYYKNMITTSLATDIMTMGQSQVGSFALGSLKNSIAGAVAEATIRRIAEVIDRELIIQTYELNGWNPARRGVMDYDNLNDADLEGMSKYLQRVASVGLIEKDREVLNAVRMNIGIDPLPNDIEPRVELIDFTSRAGDGMAKGSGNGTSDSAASADTSALNLDNAA